MSKTIGERPIEPNCYETEREEQWHDVGYYDGYNDAISKACEWLSENYEEIQCSQGRMDDIKRHLDDFRKTMEE